MKKEKGGFLRWPWNVVIYALLLLALRLFAVPIILALLALQRKNNPHGAAEGYCLSRTRKQLSQLLWAILALAGSAGLFCMLAAGLTLDRVDWEPMDYATLAFCGIGGPLLLAVGIYLGYTAVRDAFFPEKSALAQSIRNQLPYPEEAPPVERLFSMVDADLQENAQWFGPVGVGKEWVLGESANRIDRIRGIFVVDELHQHQTQTGTRTSRNLELVLIDNRWQRAVTSFRDRQELQAAADCIALRVPDAKRGRNGENLTFWNLDETAREDFEREFRRKQSRRASERAQRELWDNVPQDTILRQADGQTTSRVTVSRIEEQLRTCLDRGEGRFVLTPNRPIEATGKAFRAMHVRVTGGSVQLLAELSEKPGFALAKTAEEREAQTILTGWLRRNAPDFSAWELRPLHDPSARQSAPPPSRTSHAKLSLVYASGAAENHTTFTDEDVRLAAEGIVDGSYQLVELTHPAGYLWIRVAAGNRSDGRCTVEASKPGGEHLEFYTAKMPPRKAAAWLTEYPRSLPGGEGWKRMKK